MTQTVYSRNLSHILHVFSPNHKKKRKFQLRQRKFLTEYFLGGEIYTCRSCGLYKSLLFVFVEMTSAKFLTGQTLMVCFGATREKLLPRNSPRSPWSAGNITILHNPIKSSFEDKTAPSEKKLVNIRKLSYYSNEIRLRMLKKS